MCYSRCSLYPTLAIRCANPPGRVVRRNLGTDRIRTIPKQEVDAIRTKGSGETGHVPALALVLERCLQTLQRLLRALNVDRVGRIRRIKKEAAEENGVKMTAMMKRMFEGVF